MLLARRRTKLLITFGMVATVSSIVWVKAASSSVIEQAPSATTTLICGVIENLDCPFFLDYDGTSATLVVTPVASGAGPFNRSLTIDGSEVTTGPTTLGMQLHPRTGIDWATPDTVMNFQNSSVSSVVSFRSDSLPNKTILRNDNSAGISYYYNEFGNDDVSPEFKAIYKLASNEIDVAAPWLKPTYRIIDNELQEPRQGLATQRRADTFEDDQWIVSRFVKFMLSNDALPYFVFLVIIGVVVVGLRKFIQIVSSG
jgi:hypothetical protein